jgi:phage FluMu protein Com
MNYIEKWHCPKCSSGNPFFQPTIYHNGRVGECAGCGTRAVRHSCCHQNSFTPNIKWLPILITGISIACPGCKTVYQLSEQIQKSLDSPDWLRTGAAVVGAVAIVVGLIKLGEMLENNLS